MHLQAIEAGQGSKDDWAEFKYRHRQAEQDSRLLYSVLQQAEQFHQVRCCYMAWNWNMFDVIYLLFVCLFVYLIIYCFIKIIL